jgi:hypothetical protein
MIMTIEDGSNNRDRNNIGHTETYYYHTIVYYKGEVVASEWFGNHHQRACIILERLRDKTKDIN